MVTDAASKSNIADIDAACAIAANAVRTRYEDIPQDVINITKLDVLDYFACAFVGSVSEGIPQVVDLARELGGKEEVSLMVYGGKVSLLEGCLANGAMAHAPDYDSTHEGAHLHPSVSTITAALAVAERLGGVSGKEFLNAVVLGTDVVARLGMAYPMFPAGFIWTLVYGYFGCAVAAGKLLKLNEEQMIQAIALAYVQAAGNQQCNLDGTVGKRMGLGLAARGGVLAALMAQKGITGGRNTFEGKRGIFFTYNQSRYTREPLVERLGEYFEGINLSFKPYPTCRFNHAHIDAALAMHQEHQIKADEIESIIAYVEREGHSQFDPLDIKRNPRTLVDAQFSMPYTVAVALLKGRMTIDDFTPEAIKDPVVIKVANKVSAGLDASLGAHEPAAARLEVKTRRGTFTKHVEYPLGHPLNPISDEALKDKVRDCAAHAAKPMAKARVEELIATAGRLESLADVRELVKLVS